MKRKKTKQSSLTSAVSVTAPTWEDNIVRHRWGMVTPLLSKRNDIGLDDSELPWHLNKFMGGIHALSTCVYLIPKTSV